MELEISRRKAGSCFASPSDLVPVTSRKPRRQSGLTDVRHSSGGRRDGPRRLTPLLSLAGEGLTSGSTFPWSLARRLLWQHVMALLPPRSPEPPHPSLTTRGAEIRSLGRGRVSGSSSSSDAPSPFPSLTTPGAEIGGLGRGREPHPERATRTLSDHYGHGVPDLLPAPERIHTGSRPD